ncbi:MAG: aspartate kinase [Kiritimatiellia bacterium]
MQKRLHTVEKIGGTSMSRFGEVMENVIVAGQSGPALYQRIFVVSAYSGVTNALLEDKKTSAPGVYAHFAAGRPEWKTRLEEVRALLKNLNRKFEALGLNCAEADAFVDERLDGVKDCLEDLMNLRAYGHLAPENYLPASCEMLAAIGESHSAFNSAAILRKHGVNAVCVDLARWRETEILPIEEVVRRAFENIDLAREMPIVTGYVKCEGGIMTQYSRGYSEITFSKIAAVTLAREGIIHKEFHLSTGDPVLMGVNNVEVIGNTNFDIADEMSDMNMEAIHSKASKELQLKRIPIRVKNAFDPKHPGTLITEDFVSAEPRVEMVCGREDILAIDIKDSDMVGQTGYDAQILAAISESGISYITTNTTANAITHYFPQKSGKVEQAVKRIRVIRPGATITLHEVAIVTVLGTNMKDSRFLAVATSALADAGVEILAVNQAMHRISIQFVVRREQSALAQTSLHAAFVKHAPGLSR